MSVTTTSNPSAASRCATADPIPAPAAAVTRTTWRDSIIPLFRAVSVRCSVTSLLDALPEHVDGPLRLIDQHQMPGLGDLPVLGVLDRAENDVRGLARAERVVLGADDRHRRLRSDRLKLRGERIPGQRGHRGRRVDVPGTVADRLDPLPGHRV